MDAKLWEGFLRCLRQLEPPSFAVALQLPPPQLREALQRFPDMAPGLRKFAAAPEVRATVPAATLAVIAGDASPAQAVAATQLEGEDA